MLDIIPLTLGMVQTNTFIVADTISKEAIVIDPADEGNFIAQVASQHEYKIKAIWITHAHFDHIGGVASLKRAIAYPIKVGLHAADRALWEMQGGASFFGLQFEIGDLPDLELYHGQIFKIGEIPFEVRHTPGHTPGHVVFYSNLAGVCFCGDVIFQGSIGRTDLPGGDFDQLITSIQKNILTLPDNTRLLCGHGAETSVGIERFENPFL
ncbi:MAG: MBL fold metallo-hydrolase [Anaerolineales bacterium]